MTKGVHARKVNGMKLDIDGKTITAFLGFATAGGMGVFGASERGTNVAFQDQSQALATAIVRPLTTCVEQDEAQDEEVSRLRTELALLEHRFQQHCEVLGDEPMDTGEDP